MQNKLVTKRAIQNTKIYYNIWHNQRMKTLEDAVYSLL